MGQRAGAVVDEMSRLRVAERAENFPVALRILPARRRAVLRAVYDVVRTVDDVGDEGEADPAQRLAALDALDEDLDRVFAGGAPHARVIGALAPHVGLLPVAPFHDLVAANRVDQTVTRYATRDELIGYCRLSAVPIGRLVLAAFEIDPTDAMLAASDDVCIALQLLEHLQDVGEDRGRGRIYLPADAREAAGVAETDLDAPTASPALRRLVLAESAAARDQLRTGSALVGRLHGAARLAVAGYAAGGFAAADAVDRTGGDVLGRTARTRRRDVVRHLARLGLGSTRRTGGPRP
ncbi:squalene/phytoene synthase family protein [Actinomycetospora endophytica]|uniref:Squalene/phytoene synthase family protein n=1 Tax=Actinomycetospora endophytica TaxID=2291215 RepID=A0ABS8P8R8_9PSEU|nr:squalene/phytoene synthase family protein [Actinomycetospora endophytica]MCD2194317.1 squalene/phytoene synthase family protein [Actinomycetospora endophytica]